MTASSPHPRFALRSRAWTMGAPDCERLIERPACRRKLKLRGRSTLCGLAADKSRTAWESPSRSHSSVHVRASEMSSAGDAQNAAITDSRAFFSHRPRCRMRATIADLSSVWAVAPGCMAGYLWPSTARRPLEPRIFPCRLPPASGDPDRHSSRMRLRRQNSWLRPGRSAALALRSPPAGSGSVSSFRP